MYFIWFPHNKVRLLVFLPPMMRVIELGARWVLWFYVVANNRLPVLPGGGGPTGVTYGAHIAGFVGGVLLALGDNLRTGSRGAPATAPEDVAAAAHLGQARSLLEEAAQPTAAHQQPYDAVRAGVTPAQEDEVHAPLGRVRSEVRHVPREAAGW